MSEYRERTRSSLIETSKFNTKRTAKSSGSVETKQYPSRVTTRDYCLDKSNIGLRLDGKHDVGGLFVSEKQYIRASLGEPESYSWSDSLANWTAGGNRMPSPLDGDNSNLFPSFPIAPTDNDMNNWGTSGVNRTIPTSPMWDAAQFIGELREGLPSAPGVKLVRGGSRQSIGSEYLNYEFGIKPIISDAKAIAKAYAGTEDHLKRLEQNSGRVIRRRVTLLDETAVTGTNTTTSYLNPRLPGGAGQPSDTTSLTRTWTSSRRVWFSGAYSYYFKRSDNPFLRKVQELDKVYGLEISPSLIWNLSPYSWLVDWHANIGDVMENVSRFANDGLILRWGYIMCHQVSTLEYTWGPNYMTFVSERKSRKRANPFGFATTWDNYSPRQLAILGALGISRS